MSENGLVESDGMDLDHAESLSFLIPTPKEISMSTLMFGSERWSMSHWSERMLNHSQLGENHASHDTQI